MSHTSLGVAGSVIAAMTSLLWPTPSWAQELPADLVIRLERTTCFGECPAYSVTIDAKGNVRYLGDQCVRVKGPQIDRIPVASVAALAERAARMDFFALKPAYTTIRLADGFETTITDLPTTVVTITRDGQSKQVTDYVGAPPDLKVLEDKIDEAAGTMRWVRIDEATLRQLAQNGELTSPSVRAELLRRALMYDDVEVIKALMDLGVPADTTPDQPLPPLLMVRSATAARVLLQAGADPSATGPNGETALGRASYFAPDLTAALIEAGASVDQACDSDGRTPLWVASCEGNSGTVALLLKAGASPRLGPADVSILDCVMQFREYSRQHPDNFGQSPPFPRDFDGTIAQVQHALAQKAPR